MKRDMKVNTNSRRADDRGERGAALVTMLLVTILLLGAGGALIMTTMMSANNSVGSTAEMQAFYVAEAGMQSALNVLRGNAEPLVTSTDRMSFRTAIIPDISNGPANAGPLRLAVPRLQVVVHDSLQVIDVVEEDVVHPPDAGLDVPGHRDVDEEQRALAPGLEDRLEDAPVDDRHA